MDNEAKEIEATPKTDIVTDVVNKAFAKTEQSSSPEGKEAEEAEDTGADQSKKASPEAEAEQVIKDKLAKISEILGDDPKAIDAYIKSKGYHNDPAWKKVYEMSKKLEAPGLDEKTKQEMEVFKKVTSSPEYIRMRMTQEGYKPEAIDAKLKELGHEVEAKPDDINDRLLTKYNINPQAYKSQEEYESAKNNVSDIITIAKDVVESLLESKLGKTLEPIQQELSQNKSERNASKLTKQMQNIVSVEGVLDWEKEVTPEINRFIDEAEKEGKEISQVEIYNHFLELNHKLSIEKLKTKGKKDERDEVKKNLPKNIPGSPAAGNQGLKRPGFRATDQEANNHIANVLKEAGIF